MCSPHRLQCKIKGEINRVQIKILKIPVVGYFYLIDPSKWYWVHKNLTIHLLEIKYGHYTLDTLRTMKPEKLEFTWNFSDIVQNLVY
jgi:hypothetical protein